MSKLRVGFAIGFLLLSTPALADLKDPIQECLDLIQKGKYSKPNPGAPPPPPVGSTPVVQPDKNLPLSCLDGQMSEIRVALQKQIANCQAKTPTELDQEFQFGCKMVSKRDYCLEANQRLLNLALTPGMTYSRFAQRAATDFDWFKSNGRASDRKTQFTGYFSPTSVEASEVPTAQFKFPVYSAPPGLTYIANPTGSQGCGINPVTGEPIHWCIQNPDGTYSALPTREEAYNGALRGLEIVYFKTLWDVQSLMLEGSGSVLLRKADGTTQKLVLNYAGMNGRPNNLLGNVIKCSGKKITGSIKNYYITHPQEAYTDTVHYNPSMVLYKPGIEFMGTDNIPITGGASIATDIKNSIPLGTIALINLPPVTSKSPSKCKTFSTFVISQDTGGAIRYAHIDIYRGEGAAAEDAANKTNFYGHVYTAIPKGAGRPIPGCRN